MNFKKMPFSIMFHATNKEKEPRNHSITQEQFFSLLSKVNHNAEILNPLDYLQLLDQSKFNAPKIVISFDDGMQCQFEYAATWLESLNLKGIFFIHTQPQTEGYDKILCIRNFIIDKFSDVDDFYLEFENYASSISNTSQKTPKSFLKDYPFYTDTDKRHRYLRDYILTPQQYFNTIERLMRDKSTNYADYKDINLWMTPTQICELSRRGHIIGLHTHTHPTNITRLTFDEQLKEFTLNKNILEEITKTEIKTASYPCGRFDKNTIQVMRKLKIQAAFGSSMATPYSQLTIPREDPVNLLNS